MDATLDVNKFSAARKPTGLYTVIHKKESEHQEVYNLQLKVDLFKL